MGEDGAIEGELSVQDEAITLEDESEQGNALNDPETTQEIEMEEDLNKVNKDGFQPKMFIEGFHYAYKEPFISKKTGEITAYYRCKCYKSGCKATFSLKGTMITFGKFLHTCLERVPKRRRLEVSHVLNVCAEMRSKCIELALLEPGTAAKHIAQKVLNVFDEKYRGKYSYYK